ncbi:Hint domain-containing protein [Sorangium sp. So ce136]|uniref:Hint domain-containing protein n=1 Tax=Sorangium sp. So ce136 TaxID=3133284 RepID=UPI003F0EF80B
MLSTINQTANDIVRLRFSGEGEVIEATSSHRFYSVDRGDWVRADDLQTGEHVRTATGTLAVSGVDVLPGAQRVFNLEVESEHEYFVSELRVLSHNTEPCGGDLGTRAKEIHGAVGEATQRRTTIAVTETAEGTRVVSSSEKTLRPAQRAKLRPGEVEAVGPGHAEVTGVEGARRMGLTPTQTGASRPICENCAQYLEAQGVKPASPLKD